MAPKADALGYILSPLRGWSHATPPTRGHEQPMLGPQRDHREGLDGEAGDEVEAALLGDGGEQERGFHRGEVGADAEALAATEGEVGELGEGVGPAVEEAVRVEAFGVVPQAG